jgi:hypothetical protein
MEDSPWKFKRIPEFGRIHRFITALTAAGHMSLSSLGQSKPILRPPILFLEEPYGLRKIDVSCELTYEYEYLCSGIVATWRAQLVQRLGSPLYNRIVVRFSAG